MLIDSPTASRRLCSEHWALALCLCMQHELRFFYEWAGTEGLTSRSRVLLRVWGQRVRKWIIPTNNYETEDGEQKSLGYLTLMHLV